MGAAAHGHLALVGDGLFDRERRRSGLHDTAGRRQRGCNDGLGIAELDPVDEILDDIDDITDDTSAGRLDNGR